jgi:hypothetical protein
VEIVPVVELPPAVPLTCHVTAVLDVFATAVVNVCVVPVCTLAVAGEIVMVIGETIVTGADPDTEESDEYTAVTVTVAGDGTVAGAV